MLATSTIAHAQCTKDTDCKGDRVCEAGKCTSPQALPPAPPPPPGPPPPDAAPAGDAAASGAPAPSSPATPAAVAPTPAPSAAVPPAPVVAAAPLAQPPADEPPVERRSKPALVAGIVMVSVGPVALLGALAAKNAQDSCDAQLNRDYPTHVLPLSERYREDDCNAYSAPFYVLSIGGALLTAAGIPLIVYGGKAVAPAPRMTRVQVLPWASHTSGGLRLRVDL